MPKLTQQIILPLLLTVFLLTGCQSTGNIKTNQIIIEPPKPLIVIDAGHQAKGDPSQEPLYPGTKQFKTKVSSGTSGVVSRIPEHEINLSVALKLEKNLQRAGYRVIMIRRQASINISNKERAELANNAQADLFIRLTGFNWSRVPTILVEMGYMSNPEEDNLLSKPEHQEKLAKTISEGLLNYFQR